MRKAVVALSGGMDSTTVLRYAMDNYEVDSCVGFLYGSRHNPYEQKAAADICDYYHLPYRLFDLTPLFDNFQHTSSLFANSQQNIPHGHYTAETMSSTVIPGRNMIFASMLAGYAWSRDAQAVFLGIHSGDHVVYPDCRPEFFDAMKWAIHHATDGNVRLESPFLFGTKQTILQYGLPKGVPYGLTRTCYSDQSIACGKCGACQERLEAFYLMGIADPIDYDTREILPKE